MTKKIIAGIASYFRSLGTIADNPYILGYAIKNQVLATVEPAHFSPSCMSYSATYNNTIPDKSTFNFLMQTGKNTLPKELNAGKLEKILFNPDTKIKETINNQVGNRQETKEVIDGVFGINYELFKSDYLHILNISVINTLIIKYKQLFPDNKNNNFKYTKHERIEETKTDKFIFSNGGSTMTYKFRQLPGLEPAKYFAKDGDENKLSAEQKLNDSLCCTYEIDLDARIEFQAESQILGFIGNNTAAMYQNFSTSGSYPIPGSKASKGTLKVYIKAADDGQLELKCKYNEPIVAAETEEAKFVSTDDEIGHNLRRLGPFALLLTPLAFALIPFSFIAGIGGLIYTAFVADDPTKKNHFSFEKELFKDIKLDNIISPSRMVILPGSNVYTYKNIRLLSNKQDKDDAVLFDIGYAPTAGIESIKQ